MLQEVLRDIPFSSRLLDALFVVDIHVQVCTVLFGQRDAFIIYQCGVLNGGHACTDRVFNPPRSVCVCRHTQSEVIRLIDGGLQFFKRELLRLGIAAMCQDCPRRQHLYVVCTIMSELADFLTYFPWTVGFPVMQVPRQFDIRC